MPAGAQLYQVDHSKLCQVRKKDPAVYIYMAVWKIAQLYDGQALVLL